jgi:phosphohistidine swiveling domain-containing protein
MLNKLPNPKDYDFLWTVHNVDYFKTSFVLIKEYTKRDFIFACKDKAWRAYVGKDERKKLSEYGEVFLRTKLDAYKKEASDIVKTSDKSFKETENIDFKESNKALKKHFLNGIKSASSLWNAYFFTEYFLHDKVNRIIEEENDKYLLDKVHEMQKIKFELRKIVNRTVFPGNIFDKYLDEIKRRTKRNDLTNLHYKEIADLLDGKKVSKINRKYFVLGRFNGWKPIIGKSALKIINSFDKELQKEEKHEITGQIASKGKYTGHVKIIPFDLKETNLDKEIAKMNKGDVLVTGSTGPEMIVACHKAGAIVTEEGGICSHAAIVSRELGIPCIIGTKIATQVLKDGDLIEVDAVKGVVKKIKK